MKSRVYLESRVYMERGIYLKECNPGHSECGSVSKLVFRLIQGDTAASLLTNTLLTLDGEGAGAGKYETKKNDGRT